MAEFEQELLIQPHRPAGNSAWLPTFWDGLLMSLEKMIFEYHPAFLGPSSLQGLFPLELFQAGPWRGQSALLKPRVVICFSLLLPLRILNSTTSQSLQRTLPRTFTAPVSSSSFVWVWGPVEHLSSLASLSLVSRSCHQFSQGTCYGVPPAGIRGVEVPMRCRACKCEAASSCL